MQAILETATNVWELPPAICAKAENPIGVAEKLQFADDFPLQKKTGLEFAPIMHVLNRQKPASRILLAFKCGVAASKIGQQR